MVSTHVPLETEYPKTQTEHAVPLYVEQFGMVTTHNPPETEYPEAHTEHAAPL